MTTMHWPVRLLALSLLAQAAAPAAPSFVQPNVPDFAFTTRSTADGPVAAVRPDVRTDTHTFKGARHRHEASSLKSDGGTVRLYTTIAQCDQRKMITINDAGQLFAQSPIEDVGEEVRRMQAPPAVTPGVTSVPVAVDIEVVDFNQQRPMGRLVARHFRTTTTVQPAAGSTMHASVRIQDGWYVDLPQNNCWTVPIDTQFLIDHAAETRDQLNVTLRGATRRGMAVEEEDRTSTAAGITSHQMSLVGFSESPLDVATFDVPKGYKPALPFFSGGFDLTRPDTLMNRLSSAWDGLVDWASRVIR
jgi:hypothetical protein